MNGIFFYIGLGLGLAIAAGVRPFLPALLAGALSSAGALGVSFAHGGYRFLQSDWWLLALGVMLVLAYLIQLRMGAQQFESRVPGALLAGVAIGVGALLFAGTLSDHGDAGWPGLVGGAAAAVLSQWTLRPLLARARARLADRGAREAVTIYADAIALVVALIAALFHPLGYLAAVPFAWLLIGARRRSAEKYAGLRILRR